MAINPVTPSTLYAGTWGSGVFRSTDSGDNWSAASIGLANLYINALTIIPGTPAILLAGTNGGAFRSTDGGDSWNAVSSGLSSGFVRAFAYDHSAPNIVYAATDGGDNWTAASNGLADTSALSLAIRQTTPPTIYAGTLLGGVFTSVDGGDHWSPSSNGLTNMYVYSIAIDPAATSTIWAATSGDGVFMSMDGGGSWSAINNGLANRSVSALAAVPLPGATNLFAGTGGTGVSSIFFGASALNLAVAINGPGTVSSTPPGLSCNTGCSHSFDFGSAVTLDVQPDDYCLFTGWSGDCGGTGDCALAMFTDRNVTATFSRDTGHQIGIGGPSGISYYTSLQAAYDAAPGDGTIMVWGVELTEDLNCGQSKNVTLKGGYNQGYSLNPGRTTLAGVLTVARGLLTVEGLAVW